ncbi:MAG: hypothetical protein HYV09_23845 [Deltaproteobacteria bacterium]|nr:hypothetical protein [Deltaproteobacteria bacterium]
MSARIGVVGPVLLALVLVPCAACSGRFGVSDGGEPADAGPWTTRSPRALACAVLAEATCARVDACAPFLAQTSLGRGAACVAPVTEHCVRTAGVGGSRRTPESLTACAEAIRASACGDFVARFPDNCELPPGELALDASCAFDEQCGSSLCAREPETACGTCVRAPGVGASCVFGRCARGLVCTSAGQCAKPAALGEPCGPNDPCTNLGFCDTGRCAPRRTVGQGCAGFGQCELFGESACAANSICIATKVAKPGEACDLTANALVLCEAPYRCIDDRCAPAKPEGAACGSGGAHECAGHQTECLRGRCVARVVEACRN